MPATNDLTSTSLMTTCGIGLIALFLALRQWYERRAREPDLSSADRRHFQQQDWRRGLGIALIVILGAALSVGSRISPTTEGHANLVFVIIWTGVLGLLIVLFALAMIDWLATRAYARRHRRLLARERLRILRDATKHPASSGSKHTDEGGRLPD